jgi:GTP-binding protein HflX
LDELRERIAALLPRPDVEVEVLVPYDRGDLVSRAHADGEVLSERHTEAGTRLHANVAPSLAADLAPFLV